jgi:hypothetical protein
MNKKKILAIYFSYISIYIYICVHMEKSIKEIIVKKKIIDG